MAAIRGYDYGEARIGYGVHAGHRGAQVQPGNARGHHCALAGITLVWTFSQPEFPVPVLIAAGAVFTVSIVMVIRLMMDPDSVRALQSDAMLQLASSMIDAMGDGLTEEASQEVCELLLPNTSAIAVALTNCESVLGYAGYRRPTTRRASPSARAPPTSAFAGGRRLCC